MSNQQGSGNPVKKGAESAFLALFSSFYIFLPLHDLGKMLQHFVYLILPVDPLIIRNTVQKTAEITNLKYPLIAI